jgi:Tfp pilus assembly protein PilZ
MASDDSSGPRTPTPIVLRIKLRYDDIEVMVQRFATNVGKSGLFLPTKSLQPIGAEIKFELRLADDTPALVGLGRVKAATPPDPHNARATFGMAIELQRVTPQSRALILRMLERRRAVGLPELGLPTAADIDAARAEAAHAGGRESGATHSEALLTSPRRSTGPISVANVLAVAPLAAEPPRRKRIAIGELIDSASGPIANLAVAIPGLDDDVDVAAAIARARALAGDGLDGELDGLVEASAAPLEISVEAASAELARQLGGSAVRRERSARWATPPATAAVAAEPAIDRESDAAEPATDRARDVPALAFDRAPDPDRPPDTPDPARPPGAPDPEPAAAAVQELLPAPVTERAPAVEPGPGADEIHSIDEFDLEDAEHTEMGGSPLASRTFEHGPGGGSSPIDHATLAARLDAQLAAAEAEADADELELASELGLPALRGDGADEDGSAHDLSLEEIDDFEILAEADADEGDLLAAYGDRGSPGDPEVHGSGPAVRLRSEADFAARLDLGDESDRYFVPADEFATRHVADGLSDHRPGYELDDGLALSDPHADSAVHALARFGTGDEPPDEPLDDDERDPFEPRLGVRPIFDLESTDSYTLAGVPTDSLDLDTPPPKLSPVPVSREPVLVSPPAAAALRPSLYDSPVEDFELEHALEALDVDLDDLAIPHAPSAPHAVTEVSRDPAPGPGAARSRSGPASGTGQEVRRPPLASRPPVTTGPRAVGTGAISPHRSHGVVRLPSDDGVEIDFDDDD